MRRIKSRGTKPEMSVRRVVRSLGFAYRVNVRGMPGTPDIVIQAIQTAIFVHGCWWHQHDCGAGRVPSSHAAFWKAKFKRNRERDARNAEALEKMGWTVLVVWECQTRRGLRRRLRGLLPPRKKSRRAGLDTAGADAILGQSKET